MKRKIASLIIVALLITTSFTGSVMGGYESYNESDRNEFSVDGSYDISFNYEHVAVTITSGSSNYVRVYDRETHNLIDSVSIPENFNINVYKDKLFIIRHDYDRVDVYSIDNLDPGNVTKIDEITNMGNTGTLAFSENYIFGYDGGNNKLWKIDKGALTYTEKSISYNNVRDISYGDRLVLVTDPGAENKWYMFDDNLNVIENYTTNKGGWSQGQDETIKEVQVIGDTAFFGTRQANYDGQVRLYIYGLEANYKYARTYSNQWNTLHRREVAVSVMNGEFVTTDQNGYYANTTDKNWVGAWSHNNGVVSYGPDDKYLGILNNTGYYLLDSGAILPKAPKVNTTTAYNITTENVTLKGNITDMGTADEVDVYFEYWKNGSDVVNTTTNQTHFIEEKFTANITNLSMGTTYNYRAVASGDTESLAYGETKNFTTISQEELNNTLEVRAPAFMELDTTKRIIVKMTGEDPRPVSTSPNITYTWDNHTLLEIDAQPPSATFETTDKKIAGVVQIQITYNDDGRIYRTSHELVVGQVTVKNITILPPTQKILALMGFEGDIHFMYVFTIIIVGAYTGKAFGELVGVGTIELGIILGHIAGYTTLGLAILGLLLMMFIMLNRKEQIQIPTN